MSEKGFVKFDRAIDEWEWISNPSVCLLWFHIVRLANWKDGRFQGVDVPRGSFITSIAHLAEISGLTVRNVRTALQHLEDTGEIHKKSTSMYTHIFVLNYAKYQDSESEDRQTTDKRLTNHRQTTDKRLTTIEERKNIRSKEYSIKENIKEKSEPERFQIPTEIEAVAPQQADAPKKKPVKRFQKPTHEEVSQYIAQNMYIVNPDAFYDYYESNGWKVGKNPMKDWKAAVRTWDKKDQQLRSQTRSQSRNGYNSSKPSNSFSEAFDEAFGDLYKR